MKHAVRLHQQNCNGKEADGFFCQGLVEFSLVAAAATTVAAAAKDL